MRKVLLTAVFALLLGTAGSAAQKVVKADEIVKEAKVKAADQNKAIFLIFEASWCEACHVLDTFLAAPEVAAIFDKYFIVARVTFGEGAAGHPDWDNPGSDSLVLRYGGVGSNGTASLPFVAILDQKAKLIANSNKPGKSTTAGPGTGFPTEPEEIKWFVEMMMKGAPAMTTEETHTIQEALRKAGSE
jgi:Thioredoxin-like